MRRSEQHDLLERFLTELAKPTQDGANKRNRNEKPPWYVDPDHHRAAFSHYTKYLKGELVDEDSGSHPLVHMAWRLLAIACQETGNVPCVCGEINTRHCSVHGQGDPADGYA